MRATTYEEVSSGVLLNPEARFDMAINLAHTALQKMRTEGLVVGAMLYGSAFSGDLFREPDVNPLSDLDILAITAGHSYRNARHLVGEAAVQIFSSTAVELEIMWLTERQAEMGDHAFTLPVHAWVQRQARQQPEMVIGENPTELIRPLDVDLDEYTEEWLWETRRRFQKASTSEQRTLPWALSLPHIAARRTIDVLKHTKRAGQTADVPLDVTRKGVRSVVREIYGEHDPRIWELYQRVEVMRQRFLAFLMNEVSLGDVSQSRYDATMADMAAEAIPQVLELVERIHDAFYNLGYPVYDDAYFARVAEINGRTPKVEIFMDYSYPPGTSSEWRLLEDS